MKKRGLEFEIAVRRDCQLGEGPLWAHGRLAWVDIDRGQVLVWTPEDGSVEVTNVGRSVGCIAAIAGRHDTLLAATGDGFGLVQLGVDGFDPIEDPEPDRPGNRFNDGKCDPKGRLWAGSMDKQNKKDAVLYRFEGPGTTERILTGISISNGLGWTAAGDRMFYIDTPTRRVDVLDFDADTGAASNRRPLVEFPERLGWPDGLAVDSEGAVWVAMWDGACVVRADGTTGDLLGEYPVPAQRPTSCAFGGPDLDRLYVSTARTGLDPSVADAGASGSVLVAEPGVSGVPIAPYSGALDRP